ncbi:MAG: FGGY-family carbohydrate kinase [Armatimonadetes bacterium]|nr:FGGY-family carbohydrate kinase [Armatimonadota bacterium]
MSDRVTRSGASAGDPCVLGLDVGTGGARVLVVDAAGRVRAAATRPLEGVEGPALPPGWSEQDPEAWWAAARACLREAVAAAGPAGIRAVAATSTSGTVVPVDGAGRPLRPAILYNDTRAVEEAARVQEAGAELADKLGYAFQASFALPRILWVREHEPQVFERAACFLHAADFLVARLTGEVGLSDFSNALKTGYDLADLRWGEWIEERLGLPLARLPRVFLPGEPIAAISAKAAEETGLPAGTPVAAGATDGTAAFLASGATAPGDWNATLGTTLVVRGVSPRLVRDPAGRIYCHRHPEGAWLPGGASSTGGEWLDRRFAGTDWPALDRRALQISPTTSAVYPLVRRGERLPFVNPDAEGFSELRAQPAPDLLYAAHLEGTACVERWIFEVMESLGMPVGECVYATGGGARSREWLQIRADVMGRALLRPAVVEAAFGAALLAAARTLHGSLSEAVPAMVRADCRVEPRPGMRGRYEALYAGFREACARKGLG